MQQSLAFLEQRRSKIVKKVYFEGKKHPAKRVSGYFSDVRTPGVLSCEDAVLFFGERYVALLHRLQEGAARGQVVLPSLGVIVQTFLSVCGIDIHVRLQPEGLPLLAVQTLLIVRHHILRVATSGAILSLILH